MTNLLPLLWTGFGASLAHALNTDGRVFGLAILLAVGATVIEGISN